MSQMGMERLLALVLMVSGPVEISEEAIVNMSGKMIYINPNPMKMTYEIGVMDVPDRTSE